MAQLIELFAEEEYFEVEGVYLIKRDSIYCKSLYRLYQCYNKEMFADPSYLLQRKEKVFNPNQHLLGIGLNMENIT